MNPKAPLVLGVIVILLGASAGAALLMGPSDPERAGAQDPGHAAAETNWASGVLREIGTANLTGDELLKDSDGDGLPDVIENYVYGSDPHAWSTTGEGIPDGWLARHGFDPTLPGTAMKPAATPDPGTLPPAYGGTWSYEWTIKDVYTWGRPADWDEETQGPWENGIDPHQVSYLPNGIPYAWLHYYGFDPAAAGPDLENQKLTDDDFTVRENYEHDTDPRLADTDGDGLLDSEEVHRYGSDPTRFSTSRTGISDGWLVSHGLDPADPHVGSQKTRGKGMTVLDTWEYNLERYGLQDTLRGHGLSPASISTLGHGIPDGWLVAHGRDPLDPDLPDTVLQRASDWSHIRHLEDAPDGLEPLPDIVLTVRDHYEYARPAHWNEAADGVWWHGLDPTTPDTDGDGLPDAIEIRGWYIQVTTEIGPNTQPEWRHVRSDPRLADTDGDGLTDGEEYFGRFLHDDKLIVFPPTDPRNRDTAFSGLDDKMKVLVLGYWIDVEPDSVEQLPLPGDEDADTQGLRLVRPLLDPTRRDTGGSFLPDGEELAFWLEYQERVGTEYRDLYPGSRCQDWEDWATNLPGYEPDMDLKHLLGPLGDINGDGVPNVVNPDADGDGLLNGWEIRPELYRYSEFSTALPRPATDPANPDTDCGGSGNSLEGMDDGWIVKHARVVDGHWSMSPAQWDSIEPGKSDADGNLNNDVVRYTIYRSGHPIEQTFEYTNIMEYERGTDPNVRDDSGDDLTSGWVHFWGRIYVTLDDKGDVVPDMQTIQQWSAQRFSDPLAQVGGLVKDLDRHNGEIAYRRVVEIPPGTDPVSFLRTGERYSTTITDGEGDNPGTAQVRRDGNTVERTLGVIEGVYRHTHAQDQAHGLNPYLDDTSGDGLPDSWKTFYGACEGLDPIRVDAHRTVANDGLTNLFEYLRGNPRMEGEIFVGVPWTHPCLDDSDLDGIGDAIEINNPAMNPMNPFDGVGTPGQDTDGDGIPDDEELESGTDPTLADTSFDGLLDGHNIRFNIGQGSPRIAEWIEMGIAHQFLECTRVQGVCQFSIVDTIEEASHVQFFGTASFSGLDPRERSSVVEGIPDGWLAYHHQVPPTRSDNALRAAYECNRPDWWEEASMGAWWWGTRPGQGCTPLMADLDRDGRNDRTGEDPVAAAGASHGRPHPVDVAENTISTRLDILLAAQGWGECAGNPDPCKKKWAQRVDPGNLQVPVTITDIDTPEVVPKMEPFTVTGRFCVTDTHPCLGVPRRTVTLQLDDPLDRSRSLGVAFTDDQGRFTIQGCLCPEQNLEIPTPGLVVHGRDNGTVTWEVPADTIPVGDGHEIFLRAYATSPYTEVDHPHHVEIPHDGTTYYATGRTTSLGIPVSIESATVLELDAPSRVDWDTPRNVLVTANLRDAAGGPLPGQEVTITLHQEDTLVQRTRETGTNGRISISIPTPSTDGEFTIHAEFAGTPRLEPSQTDPQQIHLQGPLELTLTLDRSDGTVHTGSSARVDVHATSRGQNAPGVGLRLILDQVEILATTGTNGRASVELPTDGLVAGSYTIQAEARATNAHAGATTTHTVNVVSGSHLVASLPEVVPRGGSFETTGRLTLPDGSGLPDRELVLLLTGEKIARFQTGPDGTFDETVALPDGIRPGLWEAVLRFAGDPGQVDGTQTSDLVRVSVPTRITLQEQTTTRGETIQITGQLRDLTDQPLRGEHLNLTIQGAPLTHVLTDGQGLFQTTWTVPENATHGPHTIRALYEGSPNGTYSPSEQDTRIIVTSTTTIRLDEIGNVTRQALPVTGRIIAMGGEAIPGAVVEIHHNDVPVGETTTREDGSFNHTLDLETEAWPGSFRVHANYPGNKTHGPAATHQDGILVVQPRLSLLAPADAGRGTNLTARAVLQDDLDRPLPDHNVTISLADHHLMATTGSDGIAELRIPLPPDTPLAEITLQADFAGATGLEPATASRSVFIKEGARLEILDMPQSVEPFQSVAITMRLSDLHGNPLADHRIGLRFAGDTTIAIVETDHEGIAHAVIPAPARDASLIVRYAGNEVYGPAEATSGQLTVLAETQGSSTPIRALGHLALVVAAIGMAGAGVIAWTRLRRDGPVITTLKQAQKRIADGDDWAATIQQAYHELVDHAAAHGFEHHPSDSPREFVQALADTAPIPPDAAVELVRLFEKATYTEVSPNPADAQQAGDSLDRIIASIEAYLEQSNDPGGGP